MDIQEQLNIFLDSIPVKEISQKIRPPTFNQHPTATVTERLVTYANEARAALRLISPFLSKDKRILEVGAGLCLLSFFLKQEGYDIVALEPATGGFDFITTLQAALVNHFHKINLQILHFRAEEIAVEREGRFSLIFSHNVLEHIPDPTKTLSILLGVMEKEGKMIHSCPNYSVPYEPHFGVPVFRAFPEITKVVFRRKIAGNEALWDSLNFITFSDVKRFATQNRLIISFQQELLYHALTRLDKDILFRQRQGNPLLVILFNILKTTGLLGLIKYLPPALGTPMAFVISRR